MKIQNNKFKIKIVGVGDYGNSTVESLGKMHIPNTTCLIVNTEWAFIYQGENQFIKIGKKTTNGLGAGALAEIGMKAAQEDKEDLADSLKGSDLIIIVAGLGGGTGSGASPVVATIGKELNIPVIAFVTTPPNFEGKIRHKNSEECIEKLQNVVDSLRVVSGEKVVEFYIANDRSDTPISKIFKEIDKTLQNEVLSAVETINLQISKGKSIQDIIKLIQGNN